MKHRNAREMAKAISQPLAHSLAEFESAYRGERDTNSLQARIASVWHRVVQDALEKRVSLSSAYLSSLHQDLLRTESVIPSKAFQCGSYPNDWTTFTDDLQDANENKIQGGEALVLAQLVWGGHLKSLSYSLGWLCVNGLRLQEDLYPLCPPPTQFDRLATALGFAGPTSWDAETLRALVGEFEKNQVPFGWPGA